MPKSGTAKIVVDGDGQTVRLPRDFQLPGTEVRVSHSGVGVLLEPLHKRMTKAEIHAIFEELDRLALEHGPFMPEGREQPPMPPDDDITSFD